MMGFSSAERDRAEVRRGRRVFGFAFAFVFTAPKGVEGCVEGGAWKRRDLRECRVREGWVVRRWEAEA